LKEFVYASPIIYEDRLFKENILFVGLKSGYLKGFDVKSGVATKELKLCDSIDASLSFSRNIGFLGCKNGDFYALRMPGLDIVWNYKAEGGIHSSAAISNGMIFFGSLDGKLYAFGQ
jgi:outer membrane protein assembly factor BamB